MKERLTQAAVLIMLAALLAGSRQAGAGEGELPSLDRSALSAADRALVRERADEAMRAGVPAEDVEVIVGRGLERGAGGPAIATLLGTAVLTARQDLPVRPVLDRIQQGLSKGVPPERVDTAARQLADGLAAARPLVDGLLRDGVAAGPPGSREAALESVARARERSVPERAITGAGEVVREREQTMAEYDRAVRALTSLMGAGLTPDAAGRVVRSAVERNFTEQDYAGLERSLSGMLRAGRSAGDIERTLERELREERGQRGGRDRGPQDRGFGGREPGSRGGRGR